MEQTDKTPYIIGGIATLLACLLCCFTASFMLYKELLINSYVQAEAVVIDHDYRSSDDGGTYYDVVEFVVDGKTYTKIAFNNRAYYREPQNIGEIILIYYNPKNPDDVLYKVPSHIFMIVVCYIVSVGCAVGVTVLLIKFFKILKREREFKSRLNLWLKN